MALAWPEHQRRQFPGSLLWKLKLLRQLSYTAVSMLRTFTFCLGLCAVAFAAQQTPTSAANAPVQPRNRPDRPKKTGVTTPGVQIPMAKLKPDAEFAVGGAPDWIAIDDLIYVSNKPKNSIVRIDPKANKTLPEVTGLNKPCSGLAVGFGSLWVPNCGDGKLTRIDLKTGKIGDSIQTGVANSEGGIAVSSDSVWVLTKGNSTLARVDPLSNKIVAETPLPTGCFTAAYGLDAVWVTCTDANQVVRVDPLTNLVSAHIEVGAKPRFLTVGEGSVWTLNQSAGSVSRIDPQSNKVTATIEVGVPGPGGDIAVGEGSVWVTAFDFPISRIDPETSKVVQQFTGAGGDAIRAGKGSVWLCDLRNGKVWKFDPKLILATTADN